MFSTTQLKVNIMNLPNFYQVTDVARTIIKEFGLFGRDHLMVNCNQFSLMHRNGFDHCSLANRIRLDPDLVWCALAILSLASRPESWELPPTGIIEVIDSLEAEAPNQAKLDLFTSRTKLVEMMRPIATGYQRRLDQLHDCD